MKYIAHQKSPTKNKSEIHCASAIRNHKSRRTTPNRQERQIITTKLLGPTKKDETKKTSLANTNAVRAKNHTSAIEQNN
jgi:hypothetical protein